MGVLIKKCTKCHEVKPAAIEYLRNAAETPQPWDVTEVRIAEPSSR